MRDKNNNTGLIIVAIMTLLVAIAGASFAYYGYLQKNKEDKIIEVKNGTLIIDYEDNSKINANTYVSGEALVSKKFDVRGTIKGSNDLEYNLTLKIDNNTYPEGTLKYILKSSNALTNGSSINILEEKEINDDILQFGSGKFMGPISDAIHSYELVITYYGSDVIEEDIEYNLSAHLIISEKTE